MVVVRSRPCIAVLVGVVILATLCAGAFRQHEDEFSKFQARMRAKQLEDARIKSQTVYKSQKQAASSTSIEWKSKYSGTWLEDQKEYTGGNMSHVNSKYAVEFYNLSLVLAGPNTHYQSLAKIHIMRIPKASSSSMSAIARRAVGCGPPGPCCRYPGEPKGSCPSKEMVKCQEAKKVIGCTDHFPLIWYLFEQRVPTITMLRNPFARSLSGFFYPGIHHNSDCTDKIDDCFVEYLRDTRWQSVVVKMFTGSYAYAPALTCESNTTCHHSLQLAVNNLPYFAFVGVAEMWELSLLVLHQKLPTLMPNLQEFLMGTEENVVIKGNRRVFMLALHSLMLPIAHTSTQVAE